MGFKEKAEDYLRMLSNNSGYTRDKANNFYYNELLDEVCARFATGYEKIVTTDNQRAYRYLIVSLGLSEQPAIMLIRAIKPEKVFFICSKESEKKVDLVVEKTAIRASDMRIKLVDTENVTEIYTTVKGIIEENKLQDKLKQLAIDVTGGKKTMGIIAAMAGSYLGVDSLYIDYKEYHSEYRQPVPGTEYPVILKDPLEVFGDREREQGITKFNAGDFIGAKELLERVGSRIANPRGCEAIAKIAEAYKHLEDMKFSAAYQRIQAVMNLIEQFKLREIPLGALNSQLKCLEPLGNIDYKDLLSVVRNKDVFWHYFAYSMAIANYYRENEKADQAALLAYRCLELLSQYLLFDDYQINSSKADYTHIDISPELLLAKVNEIGGQLFQQVYIPLHNLPRKIALLHGLIMLKALENPALDNLELEDVKNLTELRNQSRFAHGLRPLEVDEAKRFYYLTWNLAKRIFKNCQKKNQLKFNLEDLHQGFTFIKIQGDAGRC